MDPIIAQLPDFKKCLFILSSLYCSRTLNSMQMMDCSEHCLPYTLIEFSMVLETDLQLSLYAG